MNKLLRLGAIKKCAEGLCDFIEKKYFWPWKFDLASFSLCTMCQMPICCVIWWENLQHNNTFISEGFSERIIIIIN